MTKDLIAILVPLGFFLCITLSIYFYTKFRYDAIKSLGGPIPKIQGKRVSWKKIGVVVMGFALGLLIDGFLVDQGISENGFYIMGICLLFVGLSLYIADLIDKKEQEIDG